MSQKQRQFKKTRSNCRRDSVFRCYIAIRDFQALFLHEKNWLFDIELDVNEIDSIMSSIFTFW
jgi:hypothetical protein